MVGVLISSIDPGVKPILRALAFTSNLGKHHTKGLVSSVPLLTRSRGITTSTSKSIIALCMPSWKMTWRGYTQWNRWGGSWNKIWSARSNPIDP